MKKLQEGKLNCAVNDKDEYWPLWTYRGYAYDDTNKLKGHLEPSEVMLRVRTPFIATITSNNF